MKHTIRKIITSTALIGATLVGAFGQTAAAADIATLSGSNRNCSNGYRSVGVAYALDGYSSGGNVIIEGDLSDPCTDGQYAVIWYRQIAIGHAPGPWGMIRTGAAKVHFTRSMVRMSPFVTDVQVVVCRTGSDQACGGVRYLHV
jgi:hypothetical protein